MTEADRQPQDRPGRPRPLGTYRRRNGRRSTRQLAAFAAHGHRYLLAERDEVVRRRRPFDVVEVGAGDGSAALALARARPDQEILAVEVYRPGVARLLSGAAAQGIDNVRVVLDDAVDVLAAVPTGSLEAVIAWFPDPWPKHRHHDRRLLQPTVIDDIARCLRLGGALLVATDAPDYAAAIRRGLQACSTLVLSPGCERPAWRPVTPYERKARDAARPIDEIRAVRTGRRGPEPST